MPSEMIGEYEIEFEGVRLPDQEGWGAYVTIYGASKNPMHRNSLFPTQHVCVQSIFPTQQAAEMQAHQAALDLLQQHWPS